MAMLLFSTLVRPEPRLIRLPSRAAHSRAEAIVTDETSRSKGVETARTIIKALSPLELVGLAGVRVC